MRTETLSNFAPPSVARTESELRSRISVPHSLMRANRRYQNRTVSMADFDPAFGQGILGAQGCDVMA